MKTPKYKAGDQLITVGGIRARILDVNVDPNTRKYQYKIEYLTPTTKHYQWTSIGCQYLDDAEDVRMDYTDKVNKSIQEILDEE